MSIYSEELRRLLTCYDPRLEQKRIADEMNVSYETIRKTIKRLRAAYSRDNRVTATHMRILEALGIEGALVLLDPNLAPAIRDVLRSKPRLFVSPAELEGIVPLPSLAATILYTEERRLYATYRLLHGLEGETLELLGSDRRVLGLLDVGIKTAPIRACRNPRDAEELLERLLATPPILYGEKMLLDLLVYSALDYNPLASSRRMPYLEAAEERLGAPLEAPLPGSLHARYRALSRQGLLGRVYYVKYSRHLSGKHFVTAEAGAAVDLYRMGLESLSIVYVGRGEAVALATASDLDEARRRALREAGARLEKLRFAAVTLPPLEHVGCRGGWSMEPMSPRGLAECLGAWAGGENQ